MTSKIRKVVSQYFASLNRDSAPSKSNTPSKDMKLSAFRTITRLLSQIQQEQGFQVIQQPDCSPEDRHLLRLSNAFATIAVINHEIVAVVTERSAETLKVIACVSKTSTDDNSLFNKDAPPQSMFKRWQACFVQNPRPDSEDPDSPNELTISDSGILAGVDLDDDEMVKQWAEECWSNSTIARHLWILSRLLSMKEPSVGGLESRRDPSALSTRLLRYVIATCYQKIYRRLRNSTVSKPYIDSLKEIGDFDFSHHDLDAASDNEAENDRLFVIKILHRKPSSEISTPIPNLLKQANAALLGDTPQLYTKDTCAEFHRLLIELLGNFERSLKALGNSRGGEMEPTKASEEFKENVNPVMIWGYALQRLARGAALRMHLQTIAPLLRESNLRPRMSMTMAAPGEEDQQEEPDEDLKAVQPGAIVNGKVELHLWRSYLDWLRLIMSHFDAVDLLVTYVTGPTFLHEAISIKVLVPPKVDKHLLPWRQLFAEPKLFPIVPAPSVPPLQAKTDIGNAVILQFLNNVLLDASTPCNRAKALKKHWNNGDLDSTIEILEKLQSSILPGWEDTVSRLLIRLESLQEMPIVKSKLHCELSTDIQSIVRSSRFFDALVTDDFKGTLHCEACLASLLDDTAAVNENILKAIQEFGSTIGVSKRCCPVCVQLLYLLTVRRGQPFNVRGSHNTVTACTLPTWLPEDVIDSMNQHFGGWLRQELVELVQRSQLSRPRAQSTGSHRLSSDSAVRPNDNNVVLGKAPRS